MYRILEKVDLTPDIHLLKIEAPDVARKARAGQFIIFRIDEKGERIPLTVADYDRDEGTVTIVFMEVGKTTRQLALLQAGDSIMNFAGPLGIPTEIENYGTVICVAGGFAIAPIYAIAKALKNAGNRVISILGVRTRDLLFWEENMRSVSDELIITTDDGSYGQKGLVTEPLKDLLENDKSIQRVIAVGPVIMMKFCTLTTKPFDMKTIVSLNPIMIDGTGMCGGCRVSVGGKTKFACVDGPDFDGHQVDWDMLLFRRDAYLDEEKYALDHWESSEENPDCPRSTETGR